MLFVFVVSGCNFVLLSPEACIVAHNLTMKISYIILLSFLFILVLFSITTYINFKQAELVNVNSEEFERSSVIVRHSNRFQRNFLNMVSGLRGFLLTNEEFFIQTYDSAVMENEQILHELGLLVPNGSDQKILLAEINQLNKYWIDEFAIPLLEAKKNITLSDSSKTAFNQLYRRKITNDLEKDVQRSLQRKFADFSNFEYSFRNLRKEVLTASIQHTKKVSLYLTVISVVIGSVVAIFIAHYISSRVVKMVTMANTIAAGNYRVHVDDQGTGEIGQLAKALNDMAKILDSSITLLKRQRDELDQFAHIVSHDLKAPLRGIDNVVTWIEEDHHVELSTRVRDYLNVIKGRIVRAESLLKGILDYAKIGKVAKVREAVDVNELLREIKQDILQRPGIELHVQPNMPIIHTEKIPLIQVFTNLITNAFKYHDKPSGLIKIYCRDAGDFYDFFVEDDGPGIDPSYHQKIFLIFQTLHEQDTFESTGVGLAIVKKILDDRDLSITVRSEIGRGAIFSFVWPKNEYYV